MLAKLSGFKTIQQTVTVKLDQIQLLDFKLSAGELTETVRVTATGVECLTDFPRGVYVKA